MNQLMYACLNQVLVIVLTAVLSALMWDKIQSDKLERLEQYENAILECEIDLPRNQQCELIARISRTELGDVAPVSELK